MQPARSHKAGRRVRLQCTGIVRTVEVGGTPSAIGQRFPDPICVKRTDETELAPKTHTSCGRAERRLNPASEARSRVLESHDERERPVFAGQVKGAALVVVGDAV